MICTGRSTRKVSLKGYGVMEVVVTACSYTYPPPMTPFTSFEIDEKNGEVEPLRPVMRRRQRRHHAK